MTGAEWWRSYADLLPGWFTGYLAGEQSASRIDTFENQFVPGLFQTADYARSVIRREHTDPAEVDRRVELRLSRSERLLDPAGPTITAVIGEAALTRPGLDVAQARAQLDRLIELDRRSCIGISILPAAVDDLPTGEPFTVLGFPDPETADLVYLEQPGDARYLRDAADVARYRELLARLGGAGRPLGAVARDPL